MDEIILNRAVPIKYDTDVLVVGGGPAGVCAAVSASRAGVNVILAERYGIVGGMLTLGQVDPILGSVSRGTMYDELASRLHEFHPEVPVVRTHNGIEVGYVREYAKLTLDRMLAEAGVKVLLGTALVEVIVENGVISGAIFTSQSGLFAVSAKVVIDATGDGCVASLSGAKCLVGRDGDSALQPMTLEFIISGVDESVAISAWGGSDPVKIPSGEFAGMEYRELCKLKNREGELPRNVSIVRLHRTPISGERSVNATQINGVDPLDAEAIARAEVELREQIGACVEFLRKYIPGYENCAVKSSADCVGVRESRRVIGEYVICDADVEQGRQHPDAVVHNAWFLIDIHNPTGGGQAEGHARDAMPYDIPYGALLPLGVDGLLTAGRCISGTHRAHASYRVMAICMACGEAAGIAAALAAASGRTPREVSADEVRALLSARGVEL